MWSLAATERSISAALPGSANARAAVELAPTTSASRPMSRSRRWRDVSRSYPTIATAEAIAIAALVNTPMAINLRTIGRFSNQVLTARMFGILDENCEGEELGAERQVSALRGGG